MFKKLACLVLALCLCLAAMGLAEPQIEGADAYAGKDLSEEVNLVWYVLGDVPPDLDLVLETANENYFKPVLNCTLEVKFMSWSEYATKYSLILAGGEDCDMIYTASWCYFLQDVRKAPSIRLPRNSAASICRYPWPIRLRNPGNRCQSMACLMPLPAII